MGAPLWRRSGQRGEAVKHCTQGVEGHPIRKVRLIVLGLIRASWLINESHVSDRLPDQDTVHRRIHAWVHIGGLGHRCYLMGVKGANPASTQGPRHLQYTRGKSL